MMLSYNDQRCQIGSIRAGQKDGLACQPVGQILRHGYGHEGTYIALVHFRDPTSKLYLYTCSRGNPAQYDEKGVHP